MAYKRKTWVEKLHVNKEAVVERISEDFADIPAGATMLIATPMIVSEYVRHIPKGHSSSIKQMRNDLAAEYHADYTCPMTSGIFLRIVAEAAYEAYEKGTPINKITPFWRIIDSKSPTAKKLTFGLNFLKEQRLKEQLPE